MRVSKVRSVVCVTQAILTIALSEATHTRLASHRRLRGGVVSARTRSATLLPCTARVTVERWARAVFVTGLAFVLVFRYKLAVLKVLGICAVVGAAMYLIAR
jgi:hypothetical protein